MELTYYSVSTDFKDGGGRSTTCGLMNWQAGEIQDGGARMRYRQLHNLRWHEVLVLHVGSEVDCNRNDT
jgi:hypothetical protein